MKKQIIADRPIGDPYSLSVEESRMSRGGSFRYPQRRSFYLIIDWEDSLGFRFVRNKK